MEFDLFDLHLTFGACGTPGACPALCRHPCLREHILLGACVWPVELDPFGEGLLLLFVICFISIHTKMGPPPGVGYSGGEECKGCFLGTLFYISNTLQVCITPQ